jgi:replicative DNA helicase
MIPANIEAEIAVLGSCLIDPDAIQRIVTLKAEDFYRERHGWIYQAMRELTDKGMPVDFITLSNLLEKQQRLEDVGGPAYLTDLISSTPTAMYVEHYAGIIRNDALRRRIITAGSKIVEAGYALVDGDDARIMFDIHGGRRAADQVC